MDEVPSREARCVEVSIANGTVAELCVKEVQIEEVPVRVGILKIPEEMSISDSTGSLIAVKAMYSLDLLIVKTAAPENGHLSALRHLGIIVGGAKIPSLREEKVGSYVARPQISARDAEKIFIGRLRSQVAGKIMGTLGGWKVDYLGLELAYLPIRCYKIMMHRTSKSMGELAAEETEYCFELTTGSLVRLEKEELVVDFSFAQLGEIDSVALDVLKVVGSKGEITLDEVSEMLGSVERADLVIQMLIDYGLLEPVGLDTYTAVGPRENGNAVFTELDKRKLLIQGRPPKCSWVLGPGVDPAKIDTIVGVWGKIRQKADLYIPVYIGVFRKRKGEQGIEVAVLIDAIWGKRLEDFEEIIASSKVVYTVDEIISAVLEHKTEECKPVVTNG